VVIVATVRALKYNGGVAKEDLSNENFDALKKGIVNLEKHIENIKLFGVPVVVALNNFVSDTEAEVGFIREFCEDISASKPHAARDTVSTFFAFKTGSVCTLPSISVIWCFPPKGIATVVAPTEESNISNKPF